MDPQIFHNLGTTSKGDMNQVPDWGLLSITYRQTKYSHMEFVHLPPQPHSWTYSAPDPTACPIQMTTGDTGWATLPALSCSLEHICEDQLWQQQAPANSTFHTVLIICSASIFSNANMLRLLHRSVCVGPPCSPAELLRCLAWTSTTSLSHGPRILYHFTHLGHFTLLLTCSDPLVCHTA
jgi:hypothetical protein